VNTRHLPVHCCFTSLSITKHYKYTTTPPLPSSLSTATTHQPHNPTNPSTPSKMAEHNYKFNITMTCGGCSGAVERVLKKLDGASSSCSQTSLFMYSHEHDTNEIPSQASKNSTSPSTPRPRPSKPTTASTTPPSSRRSRRLARLSTRARLMVLRRLCKERGKGQEVAVAKLQGSYSRVQPHRTRSSYKAFWAYQNLHF